MMQASHLLAQNHLLLFFMPCPSALPALLNSLESELQFETAACLRFCLRLVVFVSRGGGRAVAGAHDFTRRQTKLHAPTANMHRKTAHELQ